MMINAVETPQWHPAPLDDGNVLTIPMTSSGNVIERISHLAEQHLLIVGGSGLIALQWPLLFAGTEQKLESVANDLWLRQDYYA